MKFLVFTIIIILPLHIIAAPPHKTKICTHDIDRYWAAYDSVLKVTDTTAQRQIIQSMYIDKASKGLQDFIAPRELSARMYVKNIHQKPKFWASLRPHTLQIQSYKTDIEKLMFKFKELYPKFRQPDVYFTIGCLTSGGTTSSERILIGSEIAAADSTVDASELGDWWKGEFKDNRNVVYLVAHEVGHTQQSAGDVESDNNYNLLCCALREGSCDFIAEQLLGEPILATYISYGKAHEKELWRKFKKEMEGRETKNWLYNGVDAPGGNADLGYFMGYAICKAYYDYAVDKKKAFADIIELEFSNTIKVHNFLELSRYPAKWR
jgi:hypothetical protein